MLYCSDTLEMGSIVGTAYCDSAGVAGTMHGLIKSGILGNETTKYSFTILVHVICNRVVSLRPRNCAIYAGGR